jgi:hypothetical protein
MTVRLGGEQRESCAAWVIIEMMMTAGLALTDLSE